MYYDKNGKSLEVMEWAKKLEDFDYKCVKKDILKNGIVVSTVWLGLDHNIIEQGSPLIFETMVFPKEGESSELDVDRYSTEEEALNGHQKMIDKFKESNERKD
tara:strand:- start:545 stop:853 length:309 start_codon:yes stop_codon:yes gene_type:complete